MTAMGNTEKTELTVMCMICDGTKILVQDRVNKDWPGVTFPGGHVEPARRSPTPCAARLKRRRDLISPARRYAESTILSATTARAT